MGNIHTLDFMLQPHIISWCRHCIHTCNWPDSRRSPALATVACGWSSGWPAMPGSARTDWQWLCITRVVVDADCMPDSQRRIIGFMLSKCMLICSMTMMPVWTVHNLRACYRTRHGPGHTIASTRACCRCLPVAGSVRGVDGKNGSHPG